MATEERPGRQKAAPGVRFTRLVVLERTLGKGDARWRCRCDCGKEFVVLGYSLSAGNTKSCGCLRQEQLDSGLIGKISATHSMSNTTEYRIWKGMKARCCNPGDALYPNYGGRGISVCQEWLDSFESFYAAVGNRPSKAHTIDRIDNSGNYEPGNVRWATGSEQMNNTRRTILIAYMGKTQSLDLWARELNIPHQTIRGRIKRGWTHEEALSKSGGGKA